MHHKHCPNAVPKLSTSLWSDQNIPNLLLCIPLAACVDLLKQLTQGARQLGGVL